MTNTKSQETDASVSDYSDHIEGTTIATMADLARTLELADETGLNELYQMMASAFNSDSYAPPTTYIYDHLFRVHVPSQEKTQGYAKTTSTPSPTKVDLAWWSPTAEETLRPMIESLVAHSTPGEQSNPLLDVQIPSQEREDAHAWRVLDPDWLDSFLLEQREERFFSDVLRVLVTRLDKESPLSKKCGGPLHEPHIPAEGSSESEIKICEWLSKFLTHDFDVSVAVNNYSSDHTTHLTRLSSLLVYQRAKTLLEKMWMQCAEHCLLGFAMSTLYNMKCSNPLDQQFKRTVQKRHELLQTRDSLLPYIERFKGKCGYEPIAELFLDIEQQLAAFDNLDVRWDEPIQDIESFYYTDDQVLAQTTREVYHTYRIYRDEYFAKFPTKSTMDIMTDRVRCKKVFALMMYDARDGIAWPGREIKTGVWNVYKSGPLDPDSPVLPGSSAEIFETLTSNIRQFCAYASGMHTTSDPMENLRLLKEHVANQKIFNTTDLVEKIHELKKEVGYQEKIIASLYFRHVLEKLGQGSKGGSATQRWGSFWGAASKKAAEAKANGNSHPLSDLYKVYCSYPAKLDKNAKEMYGRLSSNIHGYFCDKRIHIEADRWDVEQMHILNAIVPEATTGGNEVDWTKERARYLVGKEEDKSVNGASSTDTTDEAMPEPTAAITSPSEHGSIKNSDASENFPTESSTASTTSVHTAKP